MQEPKDAADLFSRLNHARHIYRRRDEMIKLSREMYEMSRTRKSSFLGAEHTEWRSSVAGKFWQSSNRTHNAVDIMAAVLSGNEPTYRVHTPGNVVSKVGSRAEKFLTGVWRINARRQQIELRQELAFRTTLDGGAGIRVEWSSDDYEPFNIETSINPDTGEPEIIHSFDTDNFPIGIQIIYMDKLYPLGRGRMGKPFDQMLHVESRTGNDVIYEWDGTPDANVEWLKNRTEEQNQRDEREYVEWWGQKPNGEVWHAVAYDNKFVVPPRKVPYPRIPYVLSTFKLYSKDDKALERLPFPFPIFWAVEKDEYLSSRIFRMVDLYSNLPPVYRGQTPLSLEGTWGKVANLKPDEKLEFPVWPGNPPDIYRLQQEMRDAQTQGTFSDAMYGQASSRMSGYGLSQLIGADTNRTDTPRGNLELAYSATAELIFDLMSAFAPNDHFSVTALVKNKTLSAILGGMETKALIVETFVQPKQMADQTRLAALGAQLSSLPNVPVSNAYILETYFQVAQPEDEQDRKMAEQVINDPIVRMMALHKVLQDNNSPYASLIEQQLQAAVSKTVAQTGAPPQDDTIAGIGLGMPQAIAGNPPMPNAMGSVTEETGPDRQTLMYGGPTDDLV